MPRYKLSVKGLDPDTTAVATGRNLNISPKHAREVCRAIKGMHVDDAIEYLEEVIALKKSIPFKRHRKKVGHRPDLKGWPTGRYPVKTCREVIHLLKQVKENAAFKGLDDEKLKIIHAAAMRGRKRVNFMPRAFGRSSPKVQQLVHIELVVEEVSQ